MGIFAGVLSQQFSYWWRKPKWDKHSFRWIRSWVYRDFRTKFSGQSMVVCSSYSIRV
jgi:hypothetical protein